MLLGLWHVNRDFPVCFNIRDLRTFLHYATYTCVCAHVCRLIRNHVESALIAFRS